MFLLLFLLFQALPVRQAPWSHPQESVLLSAAQTEWSHRRCCFRKLRFRTLQLGGEEVTGISIEAEAPTPSVIRHLIDTSRQLCEEIIGNTHLLPWRRHLSTVWFRI